MPFVPRRRMLAAALAAATCCAALATPAPALAQEAAYPSKPIHLIVPYPAGGGTDALARLLAARLAESWKATVLVENKTGASGMIGNDFVAKSPPDGYTVLLGITAMIQGPALFSKVPYDPVRDFTPLTIVARSADLMAVPANSPAKSVEEFIALAKADPGQSNIGNYGNGTSSHIHAAMLARQAGIELNHVPYRGAAPLLTDLMGGQLTAAMVDSSSAQPHIRSGKFKVLAVTGARSSPLAPQAPTMGSLGYHSFEPYGWFALFVPAATPSAISRKLSEEFARLIGLPEVTQHITGMGLVPGGNTMDEAAREIGADQQVWSKVITEARIRLD